MENKIFREDLLRLKPQKKIDPVWEYFYGSGLIFIDLKKKKRSSKGDKD